LPVGEASVKLEVLAKSVGGIKTKSQCVLIDHGQPKQCICARKVLIKCLWSTRIVHDGLDTKVVLNN
jgi:hypothetical protein